MKVINPGNGQTEWSVECICTGSGNGGGGCGALLLVGKSDIYRTSNSFYDGTTEHYNTFRCCQCNVETDLPRNISVPNSSVQTRNRYSEK